jgi:hypothetical protein
MELERIKAVLNNALNLTKLQKLKYGESSQTPQREFTSESDRHVMNLFYQEKNQKSIPTI